MTEDEIKGLAVKASWQLRDSVEELKSSYMKDGKFRYTLSQNGFLPNRILTCTAIKEGDDKVSVGLMMLGGEVENPVLIEKDEDLNGIVSYAEEFIKRHFTEE